MDKRNPLHVVLGIIGLAAWLLYVLACASWSPDSSKILFPYCDPETHQSGVALFDRNIGTVNSVFAQPIESCTIGDYAPMKARWSSDGSHAIVTWFEEKDKTKKNKKTKKKETVTTDWLHVEILPIGAKGRVRHFKLQDFTPSLMGWELPLVEANKNLYLGRGDEGSFVQLDLGNWHKKFRDLGDKREISFYNRDAEHVMYQRDGPESSHDLEVGKLDQQSLTLHTLFVLKKEAMAPYGAETAGGFLAFEPHGRRIAMLGEGDKDKDLIIFCTDAGLERVVAPEVPAKTYQLGGNLLWSPDGKTLFATVVTPTNDKDIEQYSLGEVPVEGGPVRLTPIVRARSGLPIALSPDGSSIAAATAYFDENKIAPADRGLFLVDLKDPDRKVTKIQFPPLQKAGGAAAKE